MGLGKRYRQSRSKHGSDASKLLRAKKFMYHMNRHLDRYKRRYG